MVVALLYPYRDPTASIQHTPYNPHNNTFFICSLHIHTNSISEQNTKCKCSCYNGGKNWSKCHWHVMAKEIKTMFESNQIGCHSFFLPWLEKSKSYRFDKKCHEPVDWEKATDFHSIWMELEMESHMWNESCFRILLS